MAENANNSKNGNNNEFPLESEVMRHEKREIEISGEQDEFERLIIENDEEFKLWMRKYDAVDARRASERLQRMGDWRCSWGKTRSATESQVKMRRSNMREKRRRLVMYHSRDGQRG